VDDIRYISAAHTLLHVVVFSMLDSESAGHERTSMLRAPFFLIVPLAALALSGLPVFRGLLSEDAVRTPVEALSNASEAGLLPVGEHPLHPVLDLARETRTYVANNVHDYQCTLIKRERIDGQLQPQRVIEMRVREGVRARASSRQPFSVYLDFNAPGDVMGRRILYRDGEQDNKMLVRKGGRRLEFVVLRLDPRGYKAQAESLVPITEVGFNRLLEAMVTILQQQIEADPSGANTQVEWMEEKDVEGRPCRAVRITHPQRYDELGFHTAVVYVDRELRVPIRIEAHDWPDAPGGSSPLIAEYTYTDLKLNAGLGDDSFDPALVRGE
jgi:hypothetical protein